MKKTLVLISVFLLILSGCSQNPQQEENAIDEKQPENQMTTEEKQEITESIPEDFQGVWNRTALYVDGEAQLNSPALLTLNKESYISTGTCTNTGRIIDGNSESYTLTIDTTDCPGVIAGGQANYIYTIEQDEETGVEVMTTVVGPVTEVYDRQS